MSWADTRLLAASAVTLDIAKDVNIIKTGYLSNGMILFR